MTQTTKVRHHCWLNKEKVKACEVSKYFYSMLILFGVGIVFRVVNNDYAIISFIGQK
jgi:hypothetical protein